MSTSPDDKAPSSGYTDDASANAAASAERAENMEEAAATGLPSYMTEQPGAGASNRETASGEHDADMTAPSPGGESLCSGQKEYLTDDAHLVGQLEDDIPRQDGQTCSAAIIAVSPDGTASCPAEEQPRAVGLGAVPGMTAASHAVGGSDNAWDYTAKDTAREARAVEPADHTGYSTPAPAPETAAQEAGKKTESKQKKRFGLPGIGASGGKKNAPRPPKRSNIPPFAATHPLLPVESTLPPSLGSRIYKALAFSPLLTVTFLLALQTIFTLDARDLWFSDEVRHADAFRNLLDGGKWLILELNGQPYPDKPPLYFIFLRVLYEALGTEGPMLHFTAAAVSAVAFLFASLALGRHVGRLDRRGNLALGLMLLSTGYFIGLTHYARMDLLFAALIVASQVCLYRAFVRPVFAPGGMVLGFVLAGLATLIKGPLALAFPVCSLLFFAVWRGSAAQARCVFISSTALAFGLAVALFGLPVLQHFGHLPEASALPLLWGVCALVPAALLLCLCLLWRDLRLCVLLSLLLMGAAFVLAGGTPYLQLPLAYALPVLFAGLLLLWQLTPQRLFRLDLYIGLAAGLLVGASWLAAIYLEQNSLDFIVESLLKTQVLERAVDTFHHKEPWHYYLLRLPFMLLPWTLLLLFIPWSKLVTRSTRDAIAASRQPEKEGLAYLWCMVLSALVLLSLLSGKIVIYFLPALPAVLVLAARAYLALGAPQAARVRIGMAVFLLLAGLLVIIGSLMLFDILPFPDGKGIPQWRLPISGGFFIVAAMLLLTGAFLWQGLSSSRPEGVLLVLGIAATAMVYPLAALVAPAFDDVMSPQKQALLMRAYAQEGYRLTSYNTYGGIYTFYAGHTVQELNSLDEAIPLADAGKVVLALHAKQADRWIGKPECFKEVHRQWIESREYALLACPPVQDLPLASAPYKPAPDLFSKLRAVLSPPAPGPALPPFTADDAAPDGAALPSENAPVDDAAPQVPSGDVPETLEQPEDHAPSQPESSTPDTDAPEAPAAEELEKTLEPSAESNDTAETPETPVQLPAETSSPAAAPQQDATEEQAVETPEAQTSTTSDSPESLVPDAEADIPVQNTDDDGQTVRETPTRQETGAATGALQDTGATSEDTDEQPRTRTAE